MPEELAIRKTYKLYINGQFPRSESGRYFTAQDQKGKTLAHLCLASRKDFRDAVVAARSAQKGWSTRTAFNRGQILYRIAEMLQGRAQQFIDELALQEVLPGDAEFQVRESIDRLVYYAGWCDKYSALFSSVNPVTGSYFNFSVPEPSGVVALIAPQHDGLLGLISVLAPCIAGGNTCVALASQAKPLCAITLAEVLNSSDVPAGVVNLLTGSLQELAPFLGNHMDVNAVVCCEADAALLRQLQELSAENVKRMIAYETVNWHLPSGAS
ncbi:MAG: aldehyde dehydrogenase family protein, partial [Chitinophagaceae bacterium]